MFTIVPSSYEISKEPQPDGSVKYTLKKSSVIAMDIPLLVMMCLVTILYSVVDYRIKKQNDIFFQQPFGGQSTAQKQKQANYLSSIKMNLITLSIIVGVTFLGVIPKKIVAIIERPERLISTLNMTNTLVLLNPLFDPFLYVMRITEVNK